MLRITEETETSQDSQTKPEFKDSQAKPEFDFGQVSAYLANERTYLAWTSTGILLMGCGVAVAKMRIALSDFSESSGMVSQVTAANEVSPIMMGMLFLILGLVTIIVSAYRFLTVQKQLKEHKYHTGDFHVLFFLTFLLILGGVLVMHVLRLHQVLD